MNLHIQKVGPTEVEPLHEILRLCGLDMRSRLGLAHWIPPYPLELMRKSVEERSVYAVYNDDQLVSTFTVGTQPPTYYRTISGVWEAWDAGGEPALYLNRLAVLPEFQGQGSSVALLLSSAAMIALLHLEAFPGRRLAPGSELHSAHSCYNGAHIVFPTTGQCCLDEGVGYI
jgi:GNAT superfamily N-acetyltransferase